GLGFARQLRHHDGRVGCALGRRQPAAGARGGGGLMARASITVCIPTRNRAGTLRQTLLAMERQTAAYDQLIVGDDASDDDTRTTVEAMRNDRLQYVRHPRNIGLYQNWNDLVGRAAGDYICIYHDHDVYLPAILEKSRSLLDQHPRMAFVHTAILFVNS